VGRWLLQRHCPLSGDSIRQAGKIDGVVALAMAVNVRSMKADEVEVLGWL
jgi:hypothetical protein